MDFNDRIPVKFPEPGHLSIFRVEKSRDSSPGNQDVGVFLVELRRADRAFRRLPELWQGIISPLFKKRGVKLEFPGRSGKTLFLVLSISAFSAFLFSTSCEKFVFFVFDSQN